MKNLFVKYIAELFILILSISASFAIEKSITLDYKETLKNQALNRIKNNLEVDKKDLQFNIRVHQTANKACDWLIKSYENLENYSKDSIGYYLGLAIISNTIFVDNQEEYRSLQNSGLIELIENDEIVTMLQNKYVAHGFMKQIEQFMLEDYKELNHYLLNYTLLYGNDLNDFGYPFQRKFVSSEKIPQAILERIKQKNLNHLFYIKRIETRIKKDTELEELIKKELF